MTDLLAERCSAAAQPTIELMGAAIECQKGTPEPFAKVIRLAQQMRAIAEQGSAGIDQPDYVAWAAGAPAVLKAMEEAAEKSDSEGVWKAFSDPQVGLHRLGTACQGQPRW